MKTIELDAERWRSHEDFYEALLPEIGAPKWHGHNRDALWDSIVHGDINGVSPPFAVRVHNVQEGDLKSFLQSVEVLFREARAEGIDVQFTLS